MLIPRGTIVGRYRVEGVLGRGGMAVVYSARDTEVDREAALKVLGTEESSSPEFVARFRREGELQASFDHPHAVTVYEAGQSEHGLYLAMRLIPGPTLALLNAERALDAPRTLDLLGQVADALDAAHAAGLVHRDVKPQNVLIGEADDAYLADFGLVRLGGASGVTATGAIVGTVAYLAPEVVRGGDAGPAADRYAFAAMAFECLTGTVPFPRPTAAAILYAHTSEPPPRISARRAELPEALDAVFARGLAKDPGERPATARALVDEVRGAITQAGRADLGPPPEASAALDPRTVEPAAVVAPAPTAPPRRSPARTLGIAAAALVIGAAVALGIRALATNDEDRQSAPATNAAAVSRLPHSQVLGSDLSRPGRTYDCLAHTPPAARAPQCTVLQTQLPGAALVVPRDGVVRRWGVRAARGELSLAVLRPRGVGAFQVARSRNEFVESPGVYTFPTDLAVERGDRLGVVVLAGSGIGARTGVQGAQTQRWIPHLGDIRRPEKGAGTGFDDEVLLRVDYVPGAEQRQPAQVRGAAAAGLHAGQVAARGHVRFKDGHRVQIKLVAPGTGLALDEFVDGRRRARVEVPGWHPGGRVLTFSVSLDDDTHEEAGIFIEYLEEDSDRVLNHYYVADLRGFELVN